MGLSSQARLVMRAHFGPPSKTIMTTGDRHDPSESSDPDVRPTQGADDGGPRDIRWQRFRIWMRRQCVGRAWSTLRPCRPADPNAWRPTKRRAPVRAAKIGESARSCCEPETRSGLSAARWAASDTSATIGHVMSTDFGGKVTRRLVLRRWIHPDLRCPCRKFNRAGS